jgi:hypothetical protein
MERSAKDGEFEGYRRRRPLDLPPELMPEPETESRPKLKTRVPADVFDDFYSSGEEPNMDEEDPFPDPVFAECPPINWNLDLPIVTVTRPERIIRRLRHEYNTQKLVAQALPP